MAAPVAAVVVGLAASPDADHVLRWAVSEAVSRAAPLRLVHAHGPEPTSREQAVRLLDTALDRCQALDARVHVTAQAVEDHDAATALAREAEGAALVVVGPPRPGRDTLLGSVGPVLAAQGTVPVVVVRGDDDASAPDRPVLVAVGVGDRSGAVVDVGYELAGVAGRSVGLVHAWDDPLVGLRGRLSLDRGADDRERARQGSALQQLVLAMRPRYPHVATRVEVPFDRADRALTERSSHAAAVVVGVHRRGRLPMVPVLQWPLGLRLARAAACPVVLVPLDPQDAQDL